jgi:hypothetical protein
MYYIIVDRFLIFLFYRWEPIELDYHLKISVF